MNPRLSLILLLVLLPLACSKSYVRSATNETDDAGTTGITLEGDCEGFVADPDVEGRGPSCLYEQGGVSVCLHYPILNQDDGRQACANVAVEGERCFATAFCDRGDATTMCWDELEEAYLYGTADIEQLCTEEWQFVTERPTEGWPADEYVRYVVHCDRQEGVACYCSWERQVPDGNPPPWDPTTFSCDEKFLCCMKGGTFPEEECNCSNDQTECEGFAEDGFTDIAFCPPGIV